MTQQQRLSDGATALGVPLNEEQRTRLLQFLALIDKWNQVHNLTALRDQDKMLTHHLLDSLTVIPHSHQHTTWLDVGSGAGLPGMVLAIARPDWRVTLVDSNHKKSSFQQQAKIELGLTNVQVFAGRVEELSVNCPFEGIISRAFSEIRLFLQLTRHLLAPQGRWYAMKGAHPEHELTCLPKTVEVERIVPLDVPGLDADRHLVIMKAA